MLSDALGEQSDREEDRFRQRRGGGAAQAFASRFSEVWGVQMRVQDAFSLPIKEDVEEIVIQNPDGTWAYIPGWSAGPPPDAIP